MMTPPTFQYRCHTCTSIKDTVAALAGRHPGIHLYCDLMNFNGYDQLAAIDDPCIQEVVEAMKLGGKSDDEINRCCICNVLLLCGDIAVDHGNSKWALCLYNINPMSPFTSCAILAVGAVHLDHSAVIEYFKREALELVQGFQCYLFGLNQMRTIAVRIENFFATGMNLERPIQQLSMWSDGLVSNNVGGGSNNLDRLEGHPIQQISIWSDGFLRNNVRGGSTSTTWIFQNH